MQKIKRQPKLIALAVSIIILISLVSTYTLAATTSESNTKIKTAAEISEVSKALSTPADIDEKVSLIKDGLRTTLKPAINAVIQANGETIETTVYDRVDKEMLNKLGIETTELDYLTQTYNQEENTVYVTLVSVTEKTVEESQIIKSSVVSIDNPYLYVGQTATIQKGYDGEKTIVYKVRYENGKETSKVMISEKIEKVAVDTIVEVGSKALPVYTSKYGFKTVENAEIPAYVDSFVVNASAYDLSFASCGKNPGDRGYGITASGMKARYGVVAVDPNVIPLGTKLYITSLDGSWTYGEAVAGDTGGAIKGNRVDLFFDSYSECISFGRRQAIVYILG